MKYDTLDLSILKTILTNKIHGLDFAYSFDAQLFSPILKPFGRAIVDYMRAYRSIPTRRTLQERHSDNSYLVNEINEVFNALESFEYNENEYAFDLDKLKKRFELWKLSEIHETLGKKLNNSNNKNTLTKEIGLTVQQIQSIHNSRSYTQRTVKEHIPRFKERYIASSQNIDNVELIKTHYSGIDFATDGLSPAEMLIIGGETNAGKSLFLSNLSIQMWMQNNKIDSQNFEQGHNVLYFSLEMPYDDCFARFLARLANVPQRSISKGVLTDEERKSVEAAEKFIELYPYEFDIVDVPRDLTVEELELRYNDAILKYRPDIVVVDYLGLMEDKKHAREQDWLRLGYLAGKLHEFARAYNVVMLTAVQLTDIKRGTKGDFKNKTEDQTVGVHRIGRSSLIMHHANIGIQIEKRVGEERCPDLKYHIIKNRKGPLLSGFLTKNFTNSALFDRSFISNEQQSSASVEDIHEKIKNLHEENE